MKFQLEWITNISKRSNSNSPRLITKLQRCCSPITSLQDSAFLKMLLDKWEPTLRCQPIWQVFLPDLSLLDSKLEAQDKLMLSMLTRLILTSSWRTSSCNLICRFHPKEFMVLVKEQENSLLHQEHGPCGAMEEQLHMMMELVVSKPTVFIHLLWSKPKKKTNGWASSSETPTLNPQLSLIKRETTQLLPTWQLVVNLKSISSQKETPKKLSLLTTTWLASQLFRHSGVLDGSLLHMIMKTSQSTTR